MDDASEIIAELVGNGFFDLEMTPAGALVYRLSANAEEISPEWFAVMRDAITRELIEYAHMGLVELRFNDDLELEYKYTPLGLEYLERLGISIDED